MAGRPRATYTSAMLTDFAKVRTGRESDAEVLVRTFRESWLVAYQGIIPHAYLTTMLHRRGKEWWTTILSGGDPPLVLEADPRLTLVGAVGALVSGKLPEVPVRTFAVRVLILLISAPISFPSVPAFLYRLDSCSRKSLFAGSINPTVEKSFVWKLLAG